MDTDSAYLDTLYCSCLDCSGWCHGQALLQHRQVHATRSTDRCRSGKRPILCQPDIGGVQVKRSRKFACYGAALLEGVVYYELSKHALVTSILRIPVIRLRGSRLSWLLVFLGHAWPHPAIHNANHTRVHTAQSLSTEARMETATSMTVTYEQPKRQMRGPY